MLGSVLYVAKISPLTQKEEPVTPGGEVAPQVHKAQGSHKAQHKSEHLWLSVKSKLFPYVSFI